MFRSHPRLLAACCFLLGGACVAGAWWWTHRPSRPLYPPIAHASAATTPADTPANQALRDFPDHLDGVSDLLKVEVAGATHVLVHIRQIHPDHLLRTLSRRGLDGLTPAALARYQRQVETIIATQDGIERVLRAMSARGYLRTIAPEGYEASSLEPADPRADFLEMNRYALLPDILDPDYNQHDDRTIDSRLQESAARFPGNIALLLQRQVTTRETNLFMFGGVDPVIRDGLATPIPNTTMSQSWMALLGNTYSKLDDRENTALTAALTHATGPFAVIVMGGWHDFCGYRTARSAVSLSQNYRDHYCVDNFPTATVSAKLDIDTHDDRISYDVARHIALVRTYRPRDRERWLWAGNQDNLGVWNDAHPEAKASLLVITPVGYDEDLPEDPLPPSTP